MDRRRAIRGASMPPRLWPSTNTRSARTPRVSRIFFTAANASSVTSSLTVKSRRPATRLPCVLVRLSYRNTAIPRLARPSARSRNTLFGPSDSSRSFGPEPWTSTTPGNGPSPTGVDRVPGSGQPPTSTITASSRNAAGVT